MASLSRWFLGALKKRVRLLCGGFFLGLIKIYQLLLSPWFGNRCRFYPSCSAYAELLLRERSMPLHRSLLYIFRRLLRCHPYSAGGIDFPPVAPPSDLKNF